MKRWLHQLQDRWLAGRVLVPRTEREVRWYLYPPRPRWRPPPPMPVLIQQILDDIARGPDPREQTERP